MPCKKINGAMFCYNRAYKYKSIYFEYNEMSDYFICKKCGAYLEQRGTALFCPFCSSLYNDKGSRGEQMNNNAVLCENIGKIGC